MCVRTRARRSDGIRFEKIKVGRFGPTRVRFTKGKEPMMQLGQPERFERNRRSVGGLVTAGLNRPQQQLREGGHQEKREEY